MPSRLRHCVVQKSSAPWACRSLRGGRNRKCGNRKIFAVWGNDAQLTKMSRIYNNTSLQNKPVHSEKVERIWSPSAYERYGFKLCSWQWDCKCCWRHVVAPNCAWIVWIGQNSDNSALNWRFTNILVLGFKSVSLSAVIVINLVDVFAVMGAWQRHLPSFTWTTIQSSDRCQAPAAGIKGTVCHFKLLTGCNVFFFFRLSLMPRVNWFDGRNISVVCSQRWRSSSGGEAAGCFQTCRQWWQQSEGTSSPLSINTQPVLQIKVP